MSKVAKSTILSFETKGERVPSGRMPPPPPPSEEDVTEARDEDKENQDPNKGEQIYRQPIIQVRNEHTGTTVMYY